MKINGHDVVRLKDNREGAAVHIYLSRHAYCVEIVDDHGQAMEEGEDASPSFYLAA